MKLSEEEVLAYMLAFRPANDDLSLCALSACQNSEEHATTEVAERLFGMEAVEAWGVMAGWDDMQHSERAPHWRNKATNKIKFERGYAIGQAAYLACETN